MEHPQSNITFFFWHLKIKIQQLSFSVSCVLLSRVNPLSNLRAWPDVTGTRNRRIYKHDTPERTGTSGEMSRLFRSLPFRQEHMPIARTRVMFTTLSPFVSMCVSMCVCVCVCVCYLGTAVRVASGTRLELTDPKLLLLGVGGYKDTKMS